MTKQWFKPALALMFAMIFVFWTSRQHFSATPMGRSLYESADDPNGAGVYEFNRLRNPQTGLIPHNMRKNELAFAQTLPKYDDATRSIQWQNRGPYNLGGRTRAIALDVTNENTILAGQVTGGMWRSDDAGAHFSQTTQPQQLHSTTCITQDKRPGHTNTWYYGTGEQYAVVSAAAFSDLFAGDGIFKSIDGAHTWSQLSSTVNDTIPNPLFQKRNFDFVWQMVTDAHDTVHDVVYAAVVNGIWRSADGGNTWAPVLGLDTSSASGVSLYSDIAITSGGVLYATISSESAAGGIYRSIDGINWVNITPPGFPTSFERIETGIAPSDESQLYIIAQTPGAGTMGHNLWHYHYVSGDGSAAGGQWTNLTANIPHDHCESYYGIDFKAYNSQSSYDMFISVHPSDTNIVFLGGTDLYRSFDGFRSYNYDWVGGYVCDTAHLSHYVYPGHHPDQHRLIFKPSNTRVAYSSNDGGIFQTSNIINDTVQWQFMNNGYNTGQFYTVAVEPGNTNSQMIIGGLQDNGSYFTNTNDFTQAWPKVFYGDGGYCAITHNRTNYYMSFQQGRIFKMSVADDGTVNGLTRMDPTIGSHYLFIAPFILDPINDNQMYLASGQVILRNDSLGSIPLVGDEYTPISQGWVKLSGTLTGSALSSPLIAALSISEANTDRLYFGTDQGQVYRLDSCHSSTNSQKVNISGSNFPVGACVSSICADRLNANNVLVTFSNYGVLSVFYTTDAGQTWTDISGNLEEHPDGSGNGPSVDWGTIYNDGHTQKYYTGTSIGLFSTSSLNGANTVWTQEGANTIGNVVVDMVISRVYDSLVVVGTHGNGVYSNKIYGATAIQNVKSDVLEFKCYPNPFGGQTTIEAGTDPADMTADIYDMNGRLVKKLAQHNTTQIIWDGKNFSGNDCAAGSYLIRVTSGGKSGLRKVVKMM